MENKQKYNYQSKDYMQLERYWQKYLAHRLGHPSPHLTFKRFLVSRSERMLCDLYDDLRFCRANRSYFSPSTFAFKTSLLTHETWWHQELTEVF